MTQDKSFTYGRVLVDDWPDYVTSWLEHRPRGLVVMPAHPWNVDFNHPNVIRYDGSEHNRKDVRDRLITAASRKPD